jgi:hypothetical protein
LNVGHFFALQVAVSNKDAKMLTELYSQQFTGTWEVQHLIRLFLMIEAEEWTDGRKVFFESLTTENIFRSLSCKA